MLVIYLICGAVSVRKSAVNINDTPYYTLFDDAMISMRYAKNFTRGDGLVWNPGGEKTEGYSNFLWVMYMTIPHFLKISQARTSLFVLISAFIFMTMTMACVYYVAGILSNENSEIQLASAVFCGLYMPLNYWSLAGMEVSLLAFLITFAVYTALIMLKKNKFSVSLYVILGVISLVRVDMAFFLLMFPLFFMIFDSAHRWKHTAALCAVFITTVGGMTIFRFLYYGDIMPNTYYLKMSGYPFILRIARGAWVLAAFFMRGWVVPFLVPLAALFLIKTRSYSLLVFVFCIQAAYSVFVGGDAWEDAVQCNRFIAVSMPVFLTAVVIGAKDIIERLRNITAAGRRQALLIAAVFFAVALNSYSIADMIKCALMKDKNPGTGVAHEKVMQAYLINELTRKDAVIGVVWAGIVPYFTDRKCIDFLGKNDRRIARLAMNLPPAGAKFLEKIAFFYPGHLKSDLEYSIGEMKPDVISGVWGAGSRVKKIVKTEYIRIPLEIFLRKDSEKIFWDIYRKMKFVRRE